jgi:hypothetical protein
MKGLEEAEALAARLADLSYVTEAGDRYARADGDSLARLAADAIAALAAAGESMPDPTSIDPMTSAFRATRFVATYWRDAVMASDVLRRTGMSHPLAMVLGALEGETNPVELGIDATRHDDFRAALGDSRGGRHIVEFTFSGYGLQHPLDCRPDLIGCPFNAYLAALDGPDRPDGRYAMAWGDGQPVYEALE